MPTSLERSILEYHHSQWMLSEMWAKKSLDDHLQLDEAQYMMGLCEFRLKRLESATQWFQQAATSRNPNVRGKANAMIGIIASSNGEYEVADAAFKSASIDLDGKDKREAESRTTLSSNDDTATHSSHRFTLQFGAYRVYKNANSAIVSLNSNLKKSGLGEAWIIEEKDRLGRTLFLVQAGRFSSRSSAITRRKRGDLPRCDVTAVP